MCHIKQVFFSLAHTFGLLILADIGFCLIIIRISRVQFFFCSQQVISVVFVFGKNSFVLEPKGEGSVFQRVTAFSQVKDVFRK